MHRVIGVVGSGGWAVIMRARQKERERAQRLMRRDRESDRFGMWWGGRRDAHHLVLCYHGDMSLLPSLFCHLPCVAHHVCISAYVHLAACHNSKHRHRSVFTHTHTNYLQHTHVQQHACVFVTTKVKTHSRHQQQGLNTSYACK